MLSVNNLEKIYTKSRFDRTPTFQLQADFAIGGTGNCWNDGSQWFRKDNLVRTDYRLQHTNFAGQVLVDGKDIHNVRTDERDRLAIHYHQSYQVRHFSSLRPNFLLDRAGCDYPKVHLFDEPQFNTQDGYIGFMLDFFRKLKADGRLVFLCVHPNEKFHLEIMQEICEQFVFVQSGTVSTYPKIR